MKQILNTLYVMTQGAYVCLDHETVKVEVKGALQMQVPLHHLGAIVTMGNVMMSPFIMARCAEDGRALVILDRNGKFKCRVVGKTSGNVLLRQTQYEAVRDRERSAAIARNMVAGKVKNARQILMRGARETTDADESAVLRKAGDTLADALFHLKDATDIDHVRGLEGEAANAYFQVFDRMVKEEERPAFRMNGRNRRPPLDPMNALLSFLYTLLLNDCISAVEGVGLDSQMGFLHVLRPGRPSLGLDIMEEFRAVLADRLALTLINRKQITEKHFEVRPGGATYLDDAGRKEVIMAYQKRKQDEFHHPVLDQKVPFGLLPHVQARLLARHLRGDLEQYTPVLYS
ncbi:CRISPR-associated protein Cas1 [Geobacter metallireducens RCH3]|uniref:CRISPR-associated endonuclease Cas1 n=1 Tax=Geobacter metallireducens (strain ATCC 53774 / DSM 7210 / GS-15) TaxID=269799 RepID=Q39WR2_GEOMG|nr:type I-C CRISPR-associated endonuclease Cas1c [Geobacter metallireducens]ABB31312.1 CRISPR-associated endodeoxyribonuclease Cas1 [Geobacter metallireducens GS-15]EHP85638.1 CRISPR-associated protein Cas1 [Geobacter metallireducens RCH3]